jgi:hypothetical protein
VWIGFFVGVFMNQQFVLYFSILVLLIVPLMLVAAATVTLFAFRAAWLVPSIPLAALAGVLAICVPMLAWAINLNPEFNRLWILLNATRLEHVADLARTPQSGTNELTGERVLPESLRDLSWGGTFIPLKGCDQLAPAFFLPQFYPLIGGDWSDGYISAPCAQLDSGWNEAFNVEVSHPISGQWWYGRY